jgi:hypothetical protein
MVDSGRQQNIVLTHQIIRNAPNDKLALRHHEPSRHIGGPECQETKVWAGVVYGGGCSRQHGSGHIPVGRHDKFNVGSPIEAHQYQASQGINHMTVEIRLTLFSGKNNWRLLSVQNRWWISLGDEWCISVATIR